MSDLVMNAGEIQRLVAELCPDGIECKPLDHVGEFIRGGGMTKKQLVEQGLPAIHYGHLYTRYGFATSETISFVSPELYAKLRKASTGDLVIASTSENTDDQCKAVVWEGIEDAAISSDAHIYKTSLVPRCAGYLLQSSEFLRYKRTHATGVKVKRLNSKEMGGFTVPVPPRPVQEAIVTYLDQFAELEAELSRRQKQYEWYRMHLLDFRRQELDRDVKSTRAASGYRYSDEYTSRSAIETVRQMMDALCPEGVEYQAVSDVFDVRNGYTPPKLDLSLWEGRPVPWFSQAPLTSAHMSNCAPHVASNRMRSWRGLRSTSTTRASRGTSEPRRISESTTEHRGRVAACLLPALFS